MDNYTKIWQRYQKCKDYFDKKGIIKSTEKSWNFYLGKQWAGCDTGGEELPILNFITPVVKYKVNVVSQNAMIATYSDLEGRGEYQEVYDALNQNFASNWEKSKMSATSFELVRQGAVQGDSYCLWDDGNTNAPPTILLNTQIMFADENISNIQKQPYILIRERLDPETVRKKARENKIPREEWETIVADNEMSESGAVINKEEVEGKVTSILCLEKRDGIVYVSRSTATCVYEPPQPLKAIDPLSITRGEPIGLKSYPIANFIWETQPFNARGVSEVARLIPNQLELNKTLARRAITVKQCAFPRIAYDSSSVENPEALNTVGEPIEVTGGGSQSVNQLVSYLNATNISSDADKLCNDLLELTKNLAGASDYATGNVNPEQASGQAIIAVRDAAQVPINENVARYKQFVEDVAIVWFDMWVAYNPDGLTIVVKDKFGNEGEKTITQEELQALKPSVMIDVSSDNQWTKLSEQQLLDNLFERGAINLEEYVDLSPDNGVVPKGKFKDLFSKRGNSDIQGEMTGLLLSMNIPEEQAQQIVGQYLSQKTAQNEAVF